MWIVVPHGSSFRAIPVRHNAVHAKSIKVGLTTRLNVHSTIRAVTCPMDSSSNRRLMTGTITTSCLVMR